MIKDGGADKQEYYDIIFSEINRIEQVLNELLLLSKPAEAVFLEKDLKESCNHVITLLETNAVLNNIQIHKNYDTEPIFIYFDENQIKQVLINMIKNSIESMPDGGNIFVSIYEKYGEVFVSILDEGKVFRKTPFKRWENHFSRRNHQEQDWVFPFVLKSLKSMEGKFLSQVN